MATLTIVIVENDKMGSKRTLVTIGDGSKDPAERIVRQICRKGGHSLNEVEDLDAAVRTLSWQKGQNRTRVIALNVESRTLVGGLPLSPELLHNLHSNPRVVRYLVSDTDPLHRRWKPDGVILAEKA